VRSKKRNDHAGRDYTAKNKHHLTPRSRGGDESVENLFLLKLDRHFYWHKLFGNKTLEEVISLLQRVHRAKGRCPYAKARRPAQCRILAAGGCHQVRNYTGNDRKPLRVYGEVRNGNGKKVLGRQRP
jgi:hypothetical protein